jgi:hypothetical protein
LISIKESLTLAYSRNDEARMSEDIISFMDTFKSTKTMLPYVVQKVYWTITFEGFIAHATSDISAVVRLMGSLKQQKQHIRRQVLLLSDTFWSVQKTDYFRHLFMLLRRLIPGKHVPA